MQKDLQEQSIQYIKGVGPQRASLLKKLGIETTLSAIYHLPMRYEDRRGLKKISTLAPDGIQTIIGKVVACDVIEIPAGRRKLKILQLNVSDGTGYICAKWFNQVYLKKVFEPGKKVVLSGNVKLAYKGRGVEMDNPEYELLGDDTDDLLHTGRIVPIYSATEGLGQKTLRTIIWNILKDHLDKIEDPMPTEILKRQKLPPLAESLMNCHFPSDVSLEELNKRESRYHKRLFFDELLLLELGLSVIKKDREKGVGIAFESNGRLISKLLELLPFRLTQAQERAVNEILDDMKSPHPMNRLLQGDVGSGKTVVALMSMLRAVECGYQSALMAPTEILAEQHFINIHGFVDALGLKASIITSGRTYRPLDEIKQGEIDIVVGTHALLEEGVKFKKLGLVVIDEQHRFGVKQRAVLRKKAHNPDVLIMTATPIPRTLTMTLYGDLDYSVIDSLPPGRTPVKTVFTGPGDKQTVYGKIDSVIKDGGQVYVVYPLIEESEKINLKSANIGEDAMKKMFPNRRIGLIHGNMKTNEREEIMNGFKKGLIDILVSTTVIEVGVDVPNASLMIIVHAERFGLSQLHQLRGRVGRGARVSECILLAYHPMSEEARRRLDVMVRTNNGFEISEADLEIRGPGELFGTKQSGMPDLKLADILRDAQLLTTARKEAFNLIEQDPVLSLYPSLRERLESFWRGKIELFKTA